MKKGALQACGCGGRKRRMAEGGSVDDMSEGEYYRRLMLLNENRGGGRRREELNALRDVNLPLQIARGWAAGTLGLPGDLQKLGRGAWVGLRAAPGSGISSALEAMGEPSTLPDTDFYREWLPGYDAAPAARAASDLGSFAGGAGATTVARGAARAAKGAQGALGTTAARRKLTDAEIDYLLLRSRAFAVGGSVQPTPDPYDELDHALDIACINCEGTD